MRNTDENSQPLAQLKQHNEQLQKQVEEMRILFDAMPVMFWQKDAENRHVRISKAAADFEGVQVEDIEGKSAYDLYPREQAEAFHKDDLEVIHSGQAKLGIIEKHTKPTTGEVTWLQTGKVPYRDKDGAIAGVIAFAVDITEQKKAEEALQQTHDALEIQNRRMARANEFVRSTLEQLTDAAQRGVTQQEILSYLESAHTEFNRFDEAGK